MFWLTVIAEFIRFMEQIDLEITIIVRHCFRLALDAENITDGEQMFQFMFEHSRGVLFKMPKNIHKVCE